MIVFISVGQTSSWNLKLKKQDSRLLLKNKQKYNTKSSPNSAQLTLGLRVRKKLDINAKLKAKV